MHLTYEDFHLFNVILE